MDKMKPLPDDLLSRYQAWRDGTFAEKQQDYEDLAENGQKPPYMVISCCDSRVNPTEIFGAAAGDMFIHRNIANLVPPYAPDGDHYGTSAAIEYAVLALKVESLIVIGHSQCGGVQACHDLCSQENPPVKSAFEFVGPYLDILRPAYGRIDSAKPEAEQVVELGHQGVIHSLENLLSFPFVAEAVAEGRLSLHGAWHDIGAGVLYTLDPDSGNFTKP